MSVSATPEPNAVTGVALSARAFRWGAITLGGLALAFFSPGAGGASRTSGVAPSVFSDISWSSGASIPHAHVEGAIAKVGSKLYVISGGSDDCTDDSPAPPTTHVDIFNAKTGVWSAGPSVSIARDTVPLAATVGTKVYLIGGRTSCLGTDVRTVEVLDLAGNTWSQLPSSSDLPLSLDAYAHCGIAAGTKIYYFGLTKIGVFDTATLTWTVLDGDPLLSSDRFCQAVRRGPNNPTSTRAKIIITGPGGGGPPDPQSQRILLFRPATNTVKLLSMRTVPLAEHTSAVLQGKVVVAGNDETFGSTRVVQFIDLKSKTVTSGSDLPSGRDDAVGAFVNGKYFILGGLDETRSTTPAVLIGTPT